MPVTSVVTGKQADGAPSPVELLAVTSKLYADPGVRPVAEYVMATDPRSVDESIEQVYPWDQ